MIVRHVLGHEAQRLREIRLRALATDPAAYGSTYAEEVDRQDAWWERGAALSEAGDEQRHFVLADDEDAWFGLALVREDDESPGDAIVNALWVAPDLRRQGYSKWLYEACIAWATEHGFPRIGLTAKLDNPLAIAAHRTMGFQPAGTRDDELLLRRTLA